MQCDEVQVQGDIRWVAGGDWRPHTYKKLIHGHLKKHRPGAGLH